MLTEMLEHGAKRPPTDVVLVGGPGSGRLMTNVTARFIVQGAAARRADGSAFAAETLYEVHPDDGVALWWGVEGVDYEWHTIDGRPHGLLGETRVPVRTRRVRAFVLERDRDVSGVSGAGTVAEGVEFTDGTVALRWTSAWPTSVVFHDRGLAAVHAVHGHGGQTRVVFAD